MAYTNIHSSFLQPLIPSKMNLEIQGEWFSVTWGLQKRKPHIRAGRALHCPAASRFTPNPDSRFL